MRATDEEVAMRLTVFILMGLALHWPTVGFGFTADKRDTLRGLKWAQRYLS